MTECINCEKILLFKDYLTVNEKSHATIQKYIHEIQELHGFVQNNKITKELLLSYRVRLHETHKAQTVNGKLSAVNAFLEFIGQNAMKLKLLRVQRKAFIEENRELSEKEYKRLLNTALSRHNERLYLLMLTICGTGIRISELAYITVAAAKCGRAEISLKGKDRVVIIPKELCRKLLKYSLKNNIPQGCIFRTKNGNPIDRSNICHDMKKLCAAADVDPNKVFPHNLRHLFARSFYSVERNLAHLADILGHSSIETTRIYVAASAREHEKIISKMKLIV